VTALSTTGSIGSEAVEGLLPSSAVKPGDALADLLEISSHVVAAVICGADGAVAASTLPDEARGAALARTAVDLLRAAGSLRPGGPSATRVEVALRDGNLVVVRDGERVIAATTVAEPPSALVLYDLRTALARSAEEPQEPTKPRRRSTRKKPPEDADVAS
jgi:predicted regulator of Ras-like GTPase activity (Roadblock/LC7/MglB family)